jgi:diamine N-acetyltransferase
MSKPAIDPVNVGPCRLRLMEETDIEQARLWRNRDDIRHRFVNSDIITPEAQQRWWESYRDREDDLFFVIEETEEGLGPVGALALYDIDNRRAEFGRLMIGEDAARGRGLAKQATTAALTIAFDHLDLDEVYLKVYPDNEPAIAVYRACGFKETCLKKGMIHMINHS